MWKEELGSGSGEADLGKHYPADGNVPNGVSARSYSPSDVGYTENLRRIKR